MLEQTAGKRGRRPVAKYQEDTEYQHPLGLGTQEEEGQDGLGVLEDSQSFGVKVLEMVELHEDEGNMLGFEDEEDEQSLGLDILI